MRALTLILALLALPAQAQDPAAQARDAARALAEASDALEAAPEARDRVAALTATLRAYEDGLAALREGLRAVTIREATLTRRLQAEEASIAQLLGVLASQGRRGPQGLLHPEGAIGTARAGMLLAAVTPALNDQAAGLRADLAEVAALRAARQEASDQLQAGLTGVQEARIALSQAIADREPLPRRFSADPVRVAVLQAAAETLDAFAGGLDTLVDGDTAAPGQSLEPPLPLPVRGTLLRRANEADAAGVRRPGLVLATEPAALVTAPAAATVRYAGPLLDYGLVAILEPRADLLIVLAGLDTLYADTGQVLPAGAALGLMGGDTGADARSPSGERGGAEATETLYMEVREGDAPVDPGRWFATD